MVIILPRPFQSNKVWQVLIHHAAIYMPRFYDATLTPQDCGLRCFHPKESLEFKYMNSELYGVCRNKIPPGKGFRQKSTDGWLHSEICSF